MFGISSKTVKITRELKCVLNNTIIDENGPGSILRDLAAFIDFFREQPRQLTDGHQLRLNLLSELNARLARPIQLGLKRPQQKSYPPTNGLYLLLRASGLTYVDTVLKKPVLVVDDQVYQTWQSLNSTERYCTLLEVWFLRGHSTIIGQDQRIWRCIPDTFREWSKFFQCVPDEGMSVPEDDNADSWMRHILGWHNVALLEIFGLATLDLAPPRKGQGWQVEKIRRTPLGDALHALLYTGFFGKLDNILNLELEDEIPFGTLQPALQPYFSQWQNNLSIPKRVPQTGVHIFRVTLWDDVWRRIAIPGSLYLDKLATIILNAFEFDHDHLDMFSYRDRFGIEKNIYHPDMEQGPWASETLVGEAPLRIGQVMTYLFDFGDCWRFAVTLEDVDVDSPITEPTILEKHGESPKQYPRWDSY